MTGPLGARSADGLVFRLFGRAIPERESWWFDPVMLQAKIAPDVTLRLEAEMRASAFHARLEFVPADAIELDPLDAKNELASFVRSFLDSIGFVEGAAVDCDAIQLELPTGEIWTLDTRFQGLGLGDEDVPFTEIAAAAQAVVGVRLALADFRAAIQAPLDTGLFCYRALEGLRADLMVRESIVSEDDGWLRLRTLTGLDRKSDIEPIKALADTRRHGRVAPVSNAQRLHALRVLRRAIVQYTRWCWRSDATLRALLDNGNAAHSGEQHDP